MSYIFNFNIVTINFQEVPNFSQFLTKDVLESKPLKGLRVGVIRETLGDGVDPNVIDSIRGAASHLEELGCNVNEVLLSLCIFHYVCVYFIPYLKVQAVHLCCLTCLIMAGVIALLLPRITSILHPCFI